MVFVAKLPNECFLTLYERTRIVFVRLLHNGISVFPIKKSINTK